MSNVNYGPYVKEIIDMIYNNNDFSYNRIVFSKNGHLIGKKIYKIGGYKALYIVMDLVYQELIDLEYSNQYLGDLRELEFSFNGICDEFQA